jgi:putative transposase
LFAEPSGQTTLEVIMMLDADVVAVSLSSVNRVLKAAGLLQNQTPNTGPKGNGFQGPIRFHQHWHMDISYINVAGTFYYLSAVLDGYSLYLVHLEIKERLIEQDVEIILQRARERFPEAHSRIISDNGPQFLAQIPQEQIHRSRKPSLSGRCAALGQNYVNECNNNRLHNAIGYITPRDQREGPAEAIFAERGAKLAVAANARSASSGSTGVRSGSGRPGTSS